MNTQVQSNKPPKRVFFAAVVVIFFSTVSAADSIGFVPSYIDGMPPEKKSTSETVALSDLPQLSELYKTTGESPAAPQGILPERIKSAAIGLDAVIQNPGTRDLDSLAAAILKSPTRYVDSAKLGVPGNMLIFGHSSTYKVVRNPMYKVFNRISELKPGDSISVEGGGVEYLYSVTSVRSVDVNETVIDLSAAQGTKLTLTTCDILTGKSARFIVEAEYVGIASTNIL
ncbi:sortase [Candidatus Kaiserbacteria bacterium]|nr:sortase [Candidatus Kaiserbacteria bacterium]